MKRLALLLVLLPAAAVAQDYTPRVLTEDEKVEALKKAYQLNGNSMVGDRMIDLTDPAVLKADRIVATIPIVPVPVPKPVADADPNGGVWPKLAEKSDTCTRHGMHKVVTGSSWRCRK